MPYLYRVKFVSRRQGDYVRHLRAARLARTQGEIACESYRAARRDNLAVLVESEEDIDTVIRALPPDAFDGVQNLADSGLLDLDSEGPRRGR